ncbi:hypothetical protein Q050_01927, partial [Pseudomonas aeruginosa BWHPSA045]
MRGDEPGTIGAIDRALKVFPTCVGMNRLDRAELHCLL